MSRLKKLSTADICSLCSASHSFSCQSCSVGACNWQYAHRNMYTSTIALFSDLSIARLSRICKINASRPLLLLSSSYVMLTYQCHSFSNSVEAVALALSITKLFGTDQSASFFLGIILAFGLFTRITFALFGAPIGIAYLYMSWQKTFSARLVPSLCI